MKHPTGYAHDREVRQNRRRYHPSSNSHRANPSSTSEKSKTSQNTRKSGPDTGQNASLEELTSPSDPKTPWMLQVPPDCQYGTVNQRLHREILAYVAYCSPTAAEKNTVETIKTCIQRVVDTRFRRAEVRVFGSFSTGLSLPSSDIDVAIAVPNLPESAVKSCLFQISSRLRNSDIAETSFVNHRARAPIIALKTTEAYGSFDMDIGINNAAGVEAIEVVKRYLATMSALRPLVLVMKGFLALRQMNDPAKGGLGSYPLICMSIFLLKSNPYDAPQECIDDPNGSESLGRLVLDFLKYYGTEFPYQTSYISVTEAFELKEKAKPTESLSVRCLIYPENEVAKSINKYSNLANAFKEGYSALHQLTPQEANSKDSLLGKIVSFDAEAIRRREMIQKSFTSEPRFPNLPNRPQQAPPSQSGPSLLSRISMDTRYAPPPQYQQQHAYGGNEMFWQHQQPGGHWGHDMYYQQQQQQQHYGYGAYDQYYGGQQYGGCQDYQYGRY